MNNRQLNPDDILFLACVGDPQLSPEGSRLAYVRQSIDKETHESKTNIYILNLDTKKTVQLTNSNKDSAPRWAPSGDRIAFISSRSGSSQIWIIDLSGGEAWHVPTKEVVQGEPIWSGSSDRIFFTANTFMKPEDWLPYPGCPNEDAKRARDQVKEVLNPKKNKEKATENSPANKKNDIKVITRLRYRLDGLGYFGDLRRQVFYIDVPPAPPADKNLAASRITDGDYDYGSPAVSPDGRFVAVSAYRADDADYALKQDVWLFEPGTNKSYLMYDSPGPVHNLRWSPDGRWISCYGHDNARSVSTRTDLFLIPAGGFAKSICEGNNPKPIDRSSVKNLTGDMDLHAGGYIGSEIRYSGGSSLNWDQSALYFAVTHYGTPYIYKATQTNSVWSIEQAVGSEKMALSGYSVSNGKIVFQSSTPTEPENLYLAQLTETDFRAKKKLTFENCEFMSNTLVGQWERFQYKAKDGQQLDGWLIYPVGLGPSEINHCSKSPLLVLVHGGPHGAYGSAFMFSAQLFAARGYCVAYFNPRGSTSYGQEFMACIDADWGNKDFGDIMSGVDHVLLKGFIDESNIFIHGWSYGGYMTTWAITQTDRFKAACAGAPVTDLYSDYGTSDITWSDEHEYGGKPWENADSLLRSSPLRHVESVNTPVLLLHGENDLRCPVIQSEEYYVALKRLGKTAVMVRYPGESHGLRKPINRIDRYNRMIAWFEYYRKKS